MSNICSVCGFHCDETATFCPTCGSPVTVATQPTIQETVQPAPQPQVQQPAQPTPQPQVQQPVQPTPQPQVQQPVQPTPQPYMQQQVQPIPQPYMQQQDYQPTEPPRKKKMTWLWILLGVFGGLFLLGIIAAVATVILYPLLYTNSNVGGNSLPQYIGSGSNGNYQEYYYPEFENASFNSEAFVDVTTEASTEASTEAPSTSFNEGAEFRPEDLTYLTLETDPAITPTATPMELDSAYLFINGGQLLPLTSDGVDALLNGSEDTQQYQLGRVITCGASIDSFIETYSVDTTNAIWETYSNDQYDYFYYSMTARPDTSDDAALIISWYQNGDTWTRMTPEEIYAFWKNGTLPACENMLTYTVYMDADSNIESILVSYGTTTYFESFYSSMQSITNAFSTTTE